MSYGVNITGGSVNVGGDIVGRDKVIALKVDTKVVEQYIRDHCHPDDVSAAIRAAKNLLSAFESGENELKSLRRKLEALLNDGEDLSVSVAGNVLTMIFKSTTSGSVNISGSHINIGGDITGNKSELQFTR